MKKLEELTKEEIKYIKSTRLWQTDMDLLCKQIKLSIHNSEETIKLHTLTLENSKRTLAHEQKYTEKGMDTYFEWCDRNNVDPYISLEEQ